MKPKMFSMLLGTALCISFTACSNSSNSVQDYPFYDMEIVQTDNGMAMRDRTDTLADVEENADIIIQGKIANDGEERSTGGEVPRTVTISSLKVTKTFKGNVKAGDIINLCEFYYVVEDGGEQVLNLHRNAMPCELGVDYLFFLYSYPSTAQWENTYATYACEKGRYPVKNHSARSSPNVDDLTIEDLYIQQDDPTVRSIYKEAAEKYMKSQ